MTKQEIIEIMKKNAWSRTTRCYADRIEHEDWVLKNELIETNADILLAKIEQEKQDTLKEFVEYVRNNTHFLPVVIDVLLAQMEHFIKEREK